MPLQLAPGIEPVPKYKLVKLLGKGSFGEVWQATTGTGSLEFPLAMKFLPLDSANTNLEKRSLELLKHLQHPNLVQVQFAEVVEEYLVIGMSLCDKSLWDRFKECKEQGRPGIPVEELLGYLHDAARAIDYLNASRHPGPDGNQVGVQHRDVKPQNLLLSGGAVRVADFGLAKVLKQTIAMLTNAMMSPAYAPPEAFKNKLAATSDQYALAVSYYQMRCGRLPLEFEDLPQLVYLHAHGSPDLSGVPERERPVLERALNKVPTARWPSCARFAKELEAVALIGVRTTEPELTTRAQQTPPARRRWPAAAFALVSVPLVAMVLAIIYFSQMPGDRGSAGRLAPDKKGQANIQSLPLDDKNTKPAVPPLDGKSVQTAGHEQSRDGAAKPTEHPSIKVASNEKKMVEGSKQPTKMKAREPSPRPSVPQPALISLQIDPPTADVKVSGEGANVEGSGGDRTISVAFAAGKASTQFKLEATQAGYRQASQDVVAAPGEVRRLPLFLQPLPAVYSVTVEPAAATLRVPAEARATGSGSRRSVEFPHPLGLGDVTLEAMLDGYRPASRTIRLEPGGSGEIALRLEPMPFVFRLTIQPADAMLRITPEGAGNLAGMGNERRLTLPRRQPVTLLAQKNGFEDQQLELVAGMGVEATREIKLIPKPAVLLVKLDPADATLTTGGATVTGSAGEREVRATVRETVEIELVAARTGYHGQSFWWKASPGGRDTRSIALRPMPPPEPATLTSATSGLTLVRIRGDTFLMGSDKSLEDDEKPLHLVKLSTYYIGKTEVTQAQYEKIMGKPPTSFLGDNLPVENVSWYDTVRFCNRLSEKEGRKPFYMIENGETPAVKIDGGNGYRLPTEAEWEYACRADGTGKFSFGDSEDELDRFAWHSKNSESSTHPVGEKEANKFGLFDMHGNVWEWCWDAYQRDFYATIPSARPAENPLGPDAARAPFRVYRGGGWNNAPGFCRSAFRRRSSPASRGSSLGFRVAAGP